MINPEKIKRTLYIKVAENPLIQALWVPKIWDRVFVKLWGEEAIIVDKKSSGFEVLFQNKGIAKRRKPQHLIFLPDFNWICGELRKIYEGKNIHQDFCIHDITFVMDESVWLNILIKKLEEINGIHDVCSD